MGNCTSKQSKESKGEPYTPSKKSNNDPQIKPGTIDSLQTSDGNKENLSVDQQTKPGTIHSQQTSDGSTKQILAKADVEPVTSVTDEKIIKPEGMITASIAETEDLEAPKENVNKEHKLERLDDYSIQEDKHIKEKTIENSDDGTKIENQQDLVKDGQFSTDENLKIIDSDEGEKNPTGPSEGEDIVRVDMITVKTGNQDGENRNFTSSTISTIEKPESRDWEFALGRPGEEAEVESEFLDMKKHQTKEDIGDTSWNKGNNPEMNVVNQHGKKKTDGPITGNGSQLGSVPDCNQSPRHDMKPSTTGSATRPNVQPTTESGTYPNVKQNPGSNNGYKNSQFAEPESGQKNSYKKLPSQGKIGSSKNDKKKKKGKNKDDLWSEFDKNFEEIPKNGNPGIKVKYMKQMNIGCKSKTINNNTTVVKEPEKNDHIQPTTTITLEDMSALEKVAESVGYLYGKVTNGTCWRVGVDKIITAYHVVEENIWAPVTQKLHTPALKHICIDFKYMNEKSGQSEQWKVEENLLFYDENLDVAVLQLKKNKNQILPPPLEVFMRLDPVRHSDDKIYLISHNNGRKKELNYGIGLWEPTETKMKKLEEFCDEYGEKNGYVGLDKKERLVIQCKFEGGASGSPGIVLYNNVPHVAFLYLIGYPTFYHKRQFSEESKQNFPQEKVLQQGVNIFSLYDTMKSNLLYLDLMNEIFRKEHETEKEIYPQRHAYAVTGGGRDGATINLQNAVSAASIEHNNMVNQQVQSQDVNQGYVPQYGRQQSQCLPSGKRQEFQMPGGHFWQKASPVPPNVSVSELTEGNSGILPNTRAPVFGSDCAESLPYLDEHIDL